MGRSGKPLDLCGREFEVRGGDVVLEVPDAARAVNGQYHVGALQKPGECDCPGVASWAAATSPEQTDPAGATKTSMVRERFDDCGG